MLDANPSNPAQSFKLRHSLHAVLKIMVLVLLLSPVLSGRAWAGPAAAPAKPTLLVMPFDLFDISLDQRPATVNPLRDWTAGIAGQIQADVRRHGRFAVIAPRDLDKLARTSAPDYTRPTTCSECLLALAKKMGAQYVVIGQVHKLSNLLIWFPVQMYDVGTGRVVFTIDLKTDGAYTNSMWRHIASNIAGRIDAAAL